MNKRINVRLDKSRYEKLIFLYKLYQVQRETDAECFRELLDAIYSEKINPSDTPTLSTTQYPELELLDDWNCAFRAVVYRFNKDTKKMEPKIDCGHATTRKIRGTTIMDLTVCKSCHDRGGSTKLLVLPAPKKPEKPEPISKPQSVQKKERKCAECGCDISRLEDWKTLCYSCWKKRQNPAWQGDTKPLRGSPLDLRQREAEAIRRANERMNTKTKTEMEE